MGNNVQNYYRSLYEIAAAINSSHRIDAILLRLVHRVSKAMDAKGSSFMILTPDKKVLAHYASYGLSDEYIQKGTVMADSSIKTALEGKPVAILNADEDERIQYPEDAAKEGIASILSVPVLLRDGVVGVIRVYSAERRHFDEEDMYFLGAVANLGAIALENAKICEYARPDSGPIGATW